MRCDALCRGTDLHCTECGWRLVPAAEVVAALARAEENLVKRRTAGLRGLAVARERRAALARRCRWCGEKGCEEHADLTDDVPSELVVA